jgi:hypothetical protein
MTQRPSPPEGPVSAKGAARKRIRAEETMTPMDKFRSLARRLIGVSREELRDEQQRYEKQKRGRGPKPHAG